jgi:diadenylate cyclase
MAVTILALRVGALFAQQLGLLITVWVLDAVTVVVLLALIVAFQPELRRALMRLDLPGRMNRAHRLPVASAVSTAAWSLARQRCGALMIVVQRDNLSELVTPGVRLDGRVSSEILEAIFQKGSPIHDGAALIEGEVISRVGVVLPLTQQARVPAEFGTRHRAGMGLAERTDALAVVVSEERGEVTLMQGERIEVLRSESALTTALSGSTTTPTAGTVRSSRIWSLANVRLIATGLALAATVWGLAFLLPGTSVRIRSVPLEFTNVPPGLTVDAQSVDTVDVWLRGSDFLFDSVNLDALVARCDLATAHAGFNVVRVRAENFDVPLGLKVDSVAPRQVTVGLAGQSGPSVR